VLIPPGSAASSTGVSAARLPRTPSANDARFLINPPLVKKP
jgi:hypothetical protein